MLANNPKYKCCLAIRFVYHGQQQTIHFPVIIDQMTKEKYNLKATNCQVHKNQQYTLFQQLCFDKILKRVLQVLRQKHRNREIKYLTLPQHLQVIQIFNASKKTPTFSESFQKQDFLKSIFIGDKKIQANNVVEEHLQDEQNTIKIYLRWPIQTIKMSFLQYYVSNISVLDINSSLKVITKDFKNTILSKLHLADKGTFCSVVYSPQHSAIDQRMKFHQYRSLFKKVSQGAQWKLILKNKENNDQRQLKLFLEKNRIDVEKLLCPISQQIMLNPRYVKKCKHYFEEIYIIIALELQRKCPLCKVQAYPKNSVLDQVAKNTMRCLLQECKVQLRLSQLMVMANVHKPDLKKKRRQKKQAEANESECKSENINLQDLDIDFE